MLRYRLTIIVGDDGTVYLSWGGRCGREDGGRVMRTCCGYIIYKPERISRSMPNLAAAGDLISLWHTNVCIAQTAPIMPVEQSNGKVILKTQQVCTGSDYSNSFK